MSRGGGKAAVNAVSDAVGSSPIDLWSESDLDSNSQLGICIVPTAECTLGSVGCQ